MKTNKRCIKAAVNLFAKQPFFSSLSVLNILSIAMALLSDFSFLISLLIKSPQSTNLLKFQRI